MKNSCSSCSSCNKLSLLVTIPIVIVAIILFITTSQQAFGETQIVIQNESSSINCVESDSCFLPSKVSIGVGQTITWTNDSSTIHTVTGGNPDDGADNTFESSIILNGEVFSHTFSESGQYQYFCSVHPWMTGVVTVE